MYLPIDKKIAGPIRYKENWQFDERKMRTGEAHPHMQIEFTTATRYYPHHRAMSRDEPSVLSIVFSRALSLAQSSTQ